MSYIMLTREEVYEKIWEMTMSDVAAQYDISHHNLKVFCTDYRVPVPPLGYWNKVAAGKVLPKQPPLPPMERNTSHVQTGAREQQELLEIRRERKASYLKEFRSVKASERLLKPHRIIQEYLGGNFGNPQAHPQNHQYTPSFTKADKRALRIFDALLKALESKGYSLLEKNSWWVEASSNSHKFQFRVREKYRQKRIPRKKQDWMSPELQRQFEGYWGETEVILEPTGVLEIATDWHRKWIDKEKLSLEQQMATFLAEVFIQRDAALIQNKRAEEEDRRRAEQEAVREQLRVTKAREKASWTTFLSMAEAWNEVKILRRFYEALVAMPVDDQITIDGRTIEDWKRWLEDKINDADPLDKGAQDAFLHISEGAERSDER